MPERDLPFQSLRFRLLAVSAELKKQAASRCGGLDAALFRAMTAGDTKEIYRRLGEPNRFDPNYKHPGEGLPPCIEVEHGDRRLVIRLLELGPDLNARSWGGKSILASAAEGSDPEIIRLLLEHGARVNEQDSLGRVPLIQAARSGRNDNVRVLLAGGALANRRDREGVTALMVAAELGHREVVASLCSAGAHQGDRDHQGHTARDRTLAALSEVSRSGDEPRRLRLRDVSRLLARRQ